jgi:hypothetical protein
MGGLVSDKMFPGWKQFVGFPRYSVIILNHHTARNGSGPHKKGPPMLKKHIRFLCLGMLLAIPAVSNAAIVFAPKLEGAGFRLSLVVPQSFDAGFGLGALADVKLIDWLNFDPSFEYSFAGHDHNHYYLANTSWLNNHWLNEFAINADLRVYPPLQGRLPFRPYVGAGFAFVISNEGWEYERTIPPYDTWHDSDTDPGLGFNFILGADIPIGNFLGNLELKFKVGHEYNLFKLTGGLTFPIRL